MEIENMRKNTSLKTIVLFPLLILSFMARAQPEPKWGATTNGLQLGSTVFQSWHTNHQSDWLCELYIRNVSTNQRKIYIHRVPNEIRYEVQLLNPQGKSVDVFQNKLLSLGSDFQHGGTVLTNEPPAFVVSFYIPEIFDIKTNGLHTLIVSERFTTNQALIFHPNQKFDYFLMPPVTISFMISSNDINR
jgi:hypothetical protein